MIEIASKVAELFEVEIELSGEEKSISHYLPTTSQTRKLLNVSQLIGIEEALIRWRNWENL
jgi:hypothetical protein